MVKKILPFLCSLAPLYAFGAEVPIDLDAGISLGSNEYANIPSSTNVVVNGTGVNVENITVITTAQHPGTTLGDLYLVNPSNSALFGMVSNADVVVRNNILINSDTGGLQLSGSSSGSTDMTVHGNITADSSLVISNIDQFQSGAITSDGLLSINAGQITTGIITSSKGNTTIVATDALEMGGIKVYIPDGTSQPAPTTQISGAGITTGYIQNLAGTMTISSSDGVSVEKDNNNPTVFTGNVENSGTQLTFNTGTEDISIDGWLTNGNGGLQINATNLTVSGGDTNNSSFVNSGIANITVVSATSFANGMNLSGMLNNGTSELDRLTIETGTLSLGTGTVIANDRAVVNITVNNGKLGTQNINISNGLSGAATNGTTTMTLRGVNIDANSIWNYGSLLDIQTISANTGDISIAGGITAVSDTVTKVIAGGALEIGDDINNSGNMRLSGASVELAGVANSGEDSVLNIFSSTQNGSIIISGSVVNQDGETNIEAKSIEVGNVTNKSGTLNIVGSDTAGSAVTIGAITVGVNDVVSDDIVMNLNAWTGGVVSDSLTVNKGVLNLGNSVHSFTSNGDIRIAGDVYLADAATAGLGDVYLTTTTGPAVTFQSVGGTLTIDGNIIATDDSNDRAAIFDAYSLDANDDVVASTITVKGADGVIAQNNGTVIFGSSDTTVSTLNIINGGVSATDGGKVEIYSGIASAQSLTESDSGEFVMHGGAFSATNGNISIDDGIWFDDSTTSVGMVIDDALNSFELSNTADDTNMAIHGGVSVGSDNTLTLNSANDVTIWGDTVLDGKLNIDAENAVTFNNAITVNNETNTALDVSGATITLAGITNNAKAVFDSATTITSTAAITNNGTFSANADGDITFGGFESNGGAVDIISNNGDVTTGVFSVSGVSSDVAISGNSVTMNSFSITGGSATVTSDAIDIANDLTVSGNIVQGDTDGMLNLINSTTVDVGGDLTIVNSIDPESDYGFIAASGDTVYDITGTADFGKSIKVEYGASADITALSIESGDVINDGVLTLKTTGDTSGLTLGNITNNKNAVTGSTLTIETNGLLAAKSFTNNGDATATITSNDMKLSGALTTAGRLYQDYSGTLSSGDVNIIGTDYTITAANVTVGGINQSDASSMIINTSDLSVVDGDITANDLTVVADPVGNWANVSVAGNVSGGVKFYGLEHMEIGRNYTYDDNSMIHAAVLPYVDGGDINATSYNYWADVSLENDGTLGQITNRNNDPQNALIYVGGRFENTISLTNGNISTVLEGSDLIAPQIGINLYNIVDQGSAIWFLFADQGLNDLNVKIRNLNVNFCNNDGTKCFNYFDSVVNTEGIDIEDGLPIYLSVRDYNNDGTNDSLYIVFDPRFGGPVKVFPIEPIVEHVAGSTDNEANAANALDEMIAGGLADAGFSNDSPIEAIPVAFEGTNLSELATELYNRMEQYVVDRDGSALARFSRLMQPTEVEQVIGNLSLNEHASFRDFEDHMFDEFIWNRNRNLEKVWFDADFGMFHQNASNGTKVKGNRFNLTAGYDWQDNKTTILGLAAHVSHTSSKDTDNIDLGYIPGSSIDGFAKTKVTDTNVGIGAYLIKTLGLKARLYGNGFVDLHLLDVSREQSYVSDIDGSGIAFSLMSEWGLLHDWLNQYIVGNLYARVGYNFGFSIKEKSAGGEYMRLKSDGYFVLTPGYSLIAQKRIYTSPWFQIRPYASIGIEYDVLGPDTIKFKFGPSKSYSEYDVELNSWWANIGGGVEMLSANGIQVGLDYRFQYNSDIQMHNIRVSGSYRF